MPVNYLQDQILQPWGWERENLPAIFEKPEMEALKVLKDRFNKNPEQFR